MQKYLYIGLASLAFAGGAYLYGFNAGVEKEQFEQEKLRQETQTELDDLGDRIANQVLELEALRRERMSLVLQLENEALAAPGADNPGIGADGVRRLEQRWSRP